MKKKITMTFVLMTFLSTLLFFSSGCSKKTVIPPGPEAGTSAAEMEGGTNINYPQADGYSEDNLPLEGTLDDASGGATGGSDADTMSDAYKKQHGRSSNGLLAIYFDFDQAGIRPDMTDVLVQNSEFLNNMTNTLIVVEGNSDERGTNEYNLALGERRAINTQQYLINLGIDPARMRTVSYGEEKPLFHGQDEESYGLNRRVDFIIE